MTVDVEDYFHVSAFEAHISRGQWDHLPCRVERNTDRILELFDRHNVQATFFVLGWVAERYPNLVRRIADAGHEVASHGYLHVRATKQTRVEFHQDVTRTKALLEDTVGCTVQGYRAPSFSIGPQTPWAFDILEKSGYRYSSSIYPIRHDLYGAPKAPRFPFRHPKTGLLEVPISTIRLARGNIPCGGGGYFRLCPYTLFRLALRSINSRVKQPAIFYFHPWEIDPGQPRQSGIGVKAGFRHYVNLSRMEYRLNRLLSDFEWNRMDSIFLRAKPTLVTLPEQVSA
jgi:polysaccharide deacetylase family protein (PEP-CTERM system associated)